MNRMHSILFMGCSSFGATTMTMSMSMSSRWLVLSMGANTRSAAAFAVHPKMIAPQQQQRTVWNALFTPNMVLSASSNNSNENDEVKPTWEYVPFDPKKKPPAPRRKPINRNFSSTPAPWTVPKTVTIPEDRLEVSFVRSSGSGGQNVNKLSTKVELRLDLKARQSWMPAEVQRRLKEEQSNKISKEGILSITAQEHRTQGMNRKSAVDKLRKMVLAAWPRPKIRKQRKGISRAAKARNKEFKKRRSDTKQNRKKVDW